MKTNFDRRKSLQELERDDWGEPNFDSYLVQTCHRLRRVPLEKFTIEDLRIMIGQQIGLLRLIPLALEKLNEDPLAEGDCYPGDLLSAVLNVPKPFWLLHTDMRDALGIVVEKTAKTLDSLDEIYGPRVRDMLLKARELISK